MTAAPLTSEGRLFDGEGRAKYLRSGECRRFLAAADRADVSTRLLCRVLYFTGCRISEALAAAPHHLDHDGGCIVLRTLKRRRLVHRAVPVPRALMRDLAAFAKDRHPDERLWPWTRQTAWRHVKGVMAAAGIEGPQATARGLRHQFGVHAIESGVSERQLQRWFGHARASNTAIYTYAVGPEERAAAARMWRKP